MCILSAAALDDAVGYATRIWRVIPYFVVFDGTRSPRLASVGEYTNRYQRAIKTRTYVRCGECLLLINTIIVNVVPSCVFVFEDTGNSFGQAFCWLFSLL